MQSDSGAQSEEIDIEGVNYNDSKNEKNKKREKQPKKAVDMTGGPFLKKILLFSVPLMLTGLLQLAYNSADVIVVGRFVGSEALAAVGSTGSLVNLFLNVFLGLSMGSGVMVARHIGERDDKKIHECVHTAMLMSLVCGVFIGTVGFFASSFMLRIMDVPDDVLAGDTEDLPF